MLGLQYDWETPCRQAKFISLSYSQCCLECCKVEEKVKITGNYSPLQKKLCQQLPQSKCVFSFLLCFKELFFFFFLVLLEFQHGWNYVRSWYYSWLKFGKLPAGAEGSFIAFSQSQKTPFFWKRKLCFRYEITDFKNTQTKNKGGYFPLFKIESDRGSGTGDDLADSQNISHS